MSALRVSRAAFAATRSSMRMLCVPFAPVKHSQSGHDAGAGSLYPGVGLAAALLAVGGSTVVCEQKPHGRKPTQILKDKIAAMIDVDGDGTLTEEEVGAFFEKIDVRHDGSVTCDALVKYLTKRGLPTNERLAVKELFEELDADGSGDISKQELYTVFRQRKRKPAEILKHKIAGVIDADGDGTLSEIELTEMFDKIDVNGDGSITYEELYSFLVANKVISASESAAVKELFKEIDQDNSGEIDKTEFCDLFLEQVLKPSELLKASIVQLIDTDGDGDLSDDELKAFFRKVDVNGDGSITIEELRAYISKAGLQVEHEVVKDLFEEIDTDASGEVSPEEFCHLFKHEVRSRYALLKEKIANIIDADGDGNLSREELHDFFAKVDVNGDGSVTFDELCNYLHKHGLSANEDETLKELFLEMDKDGSGEISRNELVRLFTGPLVINCGQLNRRRRNMTRRAEMKRKLSDERQQVAE